MIFGKINKKRTFFGLLIILAFIVIFLLKSAPNEKNLSTPAQESGWELSTNEERIVNEVTPSGNQEAETMTSKTITDDSHDNSAKLVSQKSCGDAETCYDLIVECSSIPARSVRIRAYHTNNSLGSIILTSGGNGKGFYSSAYGSGGKRVAKELHDEGFEIYEISWTNNAGWTTGTEGYGYTRALCGYTEVVKWIYENIADNPKLMCASGNSGGSMQIAYGLTAHNLDQYLNLVVLTGGPGTSDLVEAIYGMPNGNAMWDDTDAGITLTDKIEGWSDYNYVLRRESITPPDAVLKKLHDDSIVTDVLGRDYEYPFYIHFVESNENGFGDNGSIGHGQARIYFDRIESEKEWHYLGDSVTEHDVPSTREGAIKIIEILKNQCVV